MLVLANLGRYLRTSITTAYNTYVWKRLHPDRELIEETNPFILLGIFGVYLIVGSAAISAYGGDKSYMNGMFINFRAITADFSDVVPAR